MSSEDIATNVEQRVAESVLPQTNAPEQMVPQSEVDKIVHARIMREREKAQSVGMGGIAPQAGFDEEALLAKAEARMLKQLEEKQEAAQRQQMEADMENWGKSYIEKMKKGPELYDDFDDVVQDVSPRSYPDVVVMASHMENTPEIIYELGKNPRKLVDLHVLALTNPPQAQREMLKLSQSIKQNEQAVTNNVKTPSPLSKLKSSVNAGQDTGKRTISDMRKDSKYRV